MSQAPRIPELAQRDRFVRRAVKEWRVFTLADEENACVPSTRSPGRTVQLFWSSPVEAKLWAKALAGADQLQEIELQEFAADILPGVQSGKGLIGADWVSDPIEAEVDPGDLLLRLKTEAIARLLGHLSGKGELFILEGEKGPHVQTVMRRGGEVQVVQVFATRQDADRAVKRAGAKKVISDPIADFSASTLPWAIERGHLIALEPIAGAGQIEMAALDLRARLAAVVEAIQAGAKSRRDVA
jgi:Protein of unknown function (DUF2750)